MFLFDEATWLHLPDDVTYYLIVDPFFGVAIPKWQVCQPTCATAADVKKIEHIIFFVYSIYMYVYICVYICMYLYIYICICICICMCMCMYVYIYMFMFMYMYTCTHTHIHVYMHIISIYVHVETINCSESCHSPEKHPPYWYGPQLEPLDEASTNWGSPFVAGFFPQLLTRY